MTTKSTIDIQVPETNLFQNGILYDLGNNEFWLTREPLIIPPSEDDRFHTVTETDEITLLAYRFYKDFTEDAAKMWWIIADNNEAIRNSYDLTSIIGQRIRLPAWAEIKLLI